MLPAVFDRVEAYRDPDLTFFVQVYRDPDRLAWMLGHLRRHYPGARVAVCSDGDDDPRFPQLAADAGAEFYPGERLYGLECGGRICHRMLDLFFRHPTQFLFKIDTDTGFHRRFAYLPAHPGVFGTLQCTPILCSVQGGCCGFTYLAAERMYRSLAFLSPSLAGPDASWAVHEPVRRIAREQGRVSTDWLTGYVATALGLPMFGFPEVMSTWRTYVPNPDHRFAVTHPCKEMGL